MLYSIKMMRKFIFLTIVCFSMLSAFAQDSTAFRAYLYNEDYKVYLEINFDKNDIVVPGQEIFGKVPGYFGALRDSRKWLITSADVASENTAKLAITNDYGSEDLEATLVRRKDGTYLLHQESGSRLKIVVNRKWVKIPTDLVLVRSNPRPNEW